jgi:hypothetical protein
MGHSGLDETMRYAHLSPHVRREAVAKLDDLGGGAEVGHRSGTRRGVAL